MVSFHVDFLTDLSHALCIEQSEEAKMFEKLFVDQKKSSSKVEQPKKNEEPKKNEQPKKKEQ